MASRFPSNEIPRRYLVSVHNLGGGPFIWNQGVQYVKGVHHMVCLVAPVTNDSDVQDSQKLGSVCFKRGL
eukprot:4597971-Pyramimonas_sp.AAC.1